MSTKGLEKYKEDVAKGLVTKVPPEYNLIRKLEKNPKSLRLAIDAMCFNCVGGTRDHMPDPGWRHLIATCTSKGCPLLGFRPYTSSQESTETGEGIPGYGSTEREQKEAPSTAELPVVQGVLGQPAGDILGGSRGTDEVILPEVQ